MSLQDILKNYRLFINFSRSMKSYNIERTTWFSFLVFIGAFFAMYRPTLQAQKEQEEKVEIRQKLQPVMEDIQKQEQSLRETV